MSQEASSFAEILSQYEESHKQESGTKKGTVVAVSDEFVFVESHPAAGPDEGYALGYVYDSARDASDLVILDATRPEAKPVAVVHLPRRVPHGFHGSWIGDPRA